MEIIAQGKLNNNNIPFKFEKTNKEIEGNDINLAWDLPLGSLVGSDGPALTFHASFISTWIKTIKINLHGKS